MKTLAQIGSMMFSLGNARVGTGHVLLEISLYGPSY